MQLESKPIYHPWWASEKSLSLISHVDSSSMCRVHVWLTYNGEEGVWFLTQNALIGFKGWSEVCFEDYHSHHHKKNGRKKKEWPPNRTLDVCFNLSMKSRSWLKSCLTADHHKSTDCSPHAWSQYVQHITGYYILQEPDQGWPSLCSDLHHHLEAVGSVVHAMSQKPV